MRYLIITPVVQAEHAKDARAANRQVQAELRTCAQKLQAPPRPRPLALALAPALALASTSA